MTSSDPLTETDELRSSFNALGDFAESKCKDILIQAQKRHIAELEEQLTKAIKASMEQHKVEKTCRVVGLHSNLGEQQVTFNGLIKDCEDLANDLEESTHNSQRLRMRSKENQLMIEHLKRKNQKLIKEYQAQLHEKDVLIEHLKRKNEELVKQLQFKSKDSENEEPDVLEMTQVVTALQDRLAFKTQSLELKKIDLQLDRKSLIEEKQELSEQLYRMVLKNNDLNQIILRHENLYHNMLTDLNGALSVQKEVCGLVQVMSCQKDSFKETIGTLEDRTILQKVRLKNMIGKLEMMVVPKSEAESMSTTSSWDANPDKSNQHHWSPDKYLRRGFSDTVLSLCQDASPTLYSYDSGSLDPTILGPGGMARKFVSTRRKSVTSCSYQICVGGNREYFRGERSPFLFSELSKVSGEAPLYLCLGAATENNNQEGGSSSCSSKIAQQIWLTGS